MAKSPKRYGWVFGIPAFNMTQHFTYMNDLLNTENNSPMIGRIKEGLYRRASAEVASAASSLSADGKITANALDFLKRVAESERTKELMIIQDYKEKLLQQYPEDNSTINDLINQIDGNIIDNPESMGTIYANLIKYINTIRKSAQEYEQRLLDFKKHIGTEMKDLPKSDYRFRTVSDLQSMLNNLVGKATKGQEKKLNGFAARMRQHIGTYVLEHTNLLDRLTNAEDIAAVFSAIELDLTRKMQEEVNKLGLKDLAELEDLTDKILNDYINADTEEESYLQKAIKRDEDALQNILDATKNILGIKTIYGNNARNQRKALVERRIKQISNKNSLYKRLQKAKSSAALDELQYVQVEISDSNTMHGNIFELINLIQDGNTIKVRGTPATDTLHLGSFQIELLDFPLQSQFLPYLQNIGDLMTEYDQKKRYDRNNDRTQIFSSMNDEIDAQIYELEKIAQMNSQIDNLFVYHESVKLYKTAETGEFNYFHGRDMVILNYIDELYSMNGLANLELPQKDALYFLTLNLSKLAVGGQFKDSLQKYLSIFAGLLMFDDIRNMALEAERMLNDAPIGKVKQIHLYNLNGIYVPSSMILTFTYEAMRELCSKMEAGEAAKASVSTHGADSAISSYLATRPEPVKPQWPIVANEVASGTTVRIHLLSSFIQLIKSL